MPEAVAGGPHAALGLPDLCTPLPMQWHVARTVVAGPTGTETLHIVVIETAAGRLAYWFTPDDLRKFCDSLLESLTGLVVARPSDNGIAGP